MKAEEERMIKTFLSMLQGDQKQIYNCIKLFT